MKVPVPRSIHFVELSGSIRYIRERQHLSSLLSPANVYLTNPGQCCFAEVVRAGLKPIAQGGTLNPGLKAGLNQEASADF
ncbi:MAG: hypothetical protein K8F24_09060 [Bacteroidales bacterium]|nr:hypothetical protein [Bacteroidales bacterium]